MRRECWYQSGRKKQEALRERGGCVHPVAEGDLPETSAGGGGAGQGPQFPASRRTHLERDAEPPARARPGAARVSVPQQLCRFLSSGRGDRLSVSPRNQVLVLLHPLTHPSTTEVFKLLVLCRFTWIF